MRRWLRKKGGERGGLMGGPEGEERKRGARHLPEKTTQEEHRRKETEKN